MNGIIYRGIIVPASRASDGETPTSIFVTREDNGYVIWRQTAENGVEFREHKWTRDEAIEEAVIRVQDEREAFQ